MCRGLSGMNRKPEERPDFPLWLVVVAAAGLWLYVKVLTDPVYAQALAKLIRFFAVLPPWTAKAPLPGGDFPHDAFDDHVDDARRRWTFLGERYARRLVSAYGTRIGQILGAAKSMDDLGPLFGDDLTGAEVRYLMNEEFARFADDILWRRSKLGLTMSGKDREALAAFMAAA